MANRDVNIRIRGKDDTKGAFGSVTRGLNRLKGVVFSLQGALGGIAVGATIQKSLKLFAAQQESEATLAKALQLRGELTDDNIDRLKAEASQLQRITTLGDEAALVIMRNGINTGLAASKSRDLALASANLAAALGKDVDSAANQLTKTLGGYAGELGEVLPEVKELTKEQLQAGKAIDLINQKFAGFAQAHRDTFAGQIAALNNDIGDSFEKMGDRISRSLSKPGGAIETLSGIVNDLNTTLDFINKDTGGSGGGAASSGPPGLGRQGLSVGANFIPPVLLFRMQRALFRGAQDAAVAVTDIALSGQMEAVIGDQNRRLKSEVERMGVSAAASRLPGSSNLINLPEGFTPGENFVAVFDAMAKQGAFNNELRRELQNSGPDIMRSVAGFLGKAVGAGAKQLDRLGSAAEQGAAKAMFDRIINARRNRRIVPDDDVLGAIADQRIGNIAGASGLASGGQTNSLTGVAERSRDMAARAVQEAKAQRDKIIEELKNITRNTNNLGAADAVTVLEPFA